MNFSNVRDLFSRPEDDGRVRASWESFLSNGDASADSLRCLVEE